MSCMVDNENPLIKLITFINHINKVVQCGLVALNMLSLLVKKENISN